MARFIITILLATALSGCANLARDTECDLVCQKWDKYDNWGKPDPHANIDP